MEEAQRWTVTYTNHVKQKRKVYHDGFLVVQPSRNKVMLYDEWEKLLETRFVKEDLILSGESITFGSYLVDLGELCQGHQPTSGLNSQNRNEKVSEISRPFYNNNPQDIHISRITACRITVEVFVSGEDRKPMVGKRKGRVLNISPSQKIIRDFKKSEMNKVGSSPNCVDMTKFSTKDWQVLYTTQLTQKAKKFHDGFLQLIICGSQGRQVKLYDTNRRHLDGRFLKKDEVVCSGESLFLDGHIVEIGEQEEDHKPPTDLHVQGKSCKDAGKSDTIFYPAKILTNKNFPAGYERKTPGDSSQAKLTKLSDSSYKTENQSSYKTENHSSYKTENAKLSRGDVEPRRSVCDILSILRQPSERKDNPVNNPFAKDCVKSQSSEFQPDTKNHVKECAEECSETATEELRDKGSEHYSLLKVIKTEPVEVVIVADECAVSEKGRVPQARSSTFHLRPQKVNLVSPIRDVQRTNLNSLKPSSSSMESRAAVSAVLDIDIQKEVKSESLQLEIPPNIPSSEAVVIESNAALANGLSSSKLPQLKEDKNGSSSRCKNDCTSGLKGRSLKQDLNTMDMDDCPSFDLGI